MINQSIVRRLLLGAAAVSVATVVFGEVLGTWRGLLR